MWTTPLWVDAKQVAVERKVMDRAEGESVDNGGDALRLAVGHDVRRLHELALAERADRAPVLVGAHDVELEALLVEPVARFAGRVCADVGPDTSPPGCMSCTGRPGSSTTMRAPGRRR